MNRELIKKGNVAHERKKAAAFNLAQLSDFVPLRVSPRDGKVVDDDEILHVIARGKVKLNPYQGKEVGYVVLQSSAVPSFRYAVQIPDDMPSGAHMRFIRRSASEQLIRVYARSNGRRGSRKGPLFVPDPETGEPLGWFDSLLYRKVGKTWSLVEIDKRAISS